MSLGVGSPQRRRVIFMGTPDFACAALRALYAAAPNDGQSAAYEMVAVYTQPPRPKDRGQKTSLSAVHILANALSLPVYTPASLKNAEVLAEFAALAPDVLVVVAYGLLLPPAILRIPAFGCLNIHASLLPRWRGAAPIQRALLAGDQETGIGIMLMERGLDTGPVLREAITKIETNETAQSLHDRLAQMGADLIVPTLLEWLDGRLTPKPQGDSGICYAAKLAKSEGRIDFSAPAENLARQIRALNPWPGTYVDLTTGRLKILAAEAEALDASAQVSAMPAQLLDEAGLIGCGVGALRLKQVQPAGKRAMPAADWLRGCALKRGDLLPLLPTPPADDDTDIGT